MRSFLRVKYLATGAWLLRASYGLCILYEYLTNYSDRHYLWGGRGLNSDDVGTTLTLYALNSSELYFDLVFHTGILITTIFVLGVGGRLTTFVTYVFTFSLHQRNNFILDGGDNILILVLFYMMFADLSGKRIESKGDDSLLVMLHNTAMLAIVTQLCMLYFSTGMYKAMGETWQNGTAIYYVLRVHWYTWPGFSEIIYHNGPLVVAGTYGTMLLEVAFPFLLLRRETRYMALAGGVALHTGIVIFMGLVAFSWAILSIYFVLISDREYAAIARRARAAFAPPPERATILYDGVCGLCSRFVAFSNANRYSADAFGRIIPLQSQDSQRALSIYGRNNIDMDTIYVIRGSQLLERSAAILYIVQSLSWPWRAFGLLRILPRRLLDIGYRYVASNRYRLFGATCQVKDK